MDRAFDVAVAGAGPAGLAAAITAKTLNPGLSVALIEKTDQAAKKLSATGNGRGNLSNEDCDDLPRVLRFFTESGIAVRTGEAGRLYPYSEEAKSVSASLIKRAENAGVVLLTDTRVSSVEACPEGGFRIFVCSRGENREIRSKKLIVATGGKSFPAYGSSGDGYAIARSLGHRVTPLIPALTAIEVTRPLKGLKGIRAKAEVSLLRRGQVIFKEKGEVQFREDCVSGICIMNMSSYLPVASKASEGCGREMEECRLVMNLLPDFSPGDAVCFLQAKASAEGMSVGGLLETLLKKPLADMILSDLRLDSRAEAATLGMSEIVDIANAAREFSLVPCGRKGWKEAQVTKGGVDLEEINQDTMESRLTGGLYFAGEIVDYDGPCGGYNLHNAWLTGLKAGTAVASED